MLLLFYLAKGIISKEELFEFLTNSALTVDFIVIYSGFLCSDAGLNESLEIETNTKPDNRVEFFNLILGHPLFSRKFLQGKKWEEYGHLNKLFHNTFSDNQLNKIKIALGFDASNLKLDEKTKIEFEFKKAFDCGSQDFLKFTSAQPYCSNIMESYSFVASSLEKIRFDNVSTISTQKNSRYEYCIAVCFTSKNPKIDLLESALLSVTNQTGFKIDIYFVDDGSTNSADIVNLLSKLENHYKSRCNHIRFFYKKNKKSIGTYASRNKFIKSMNLLNLLVNYEYITFHDDDDVSLPNRFMYQVAQIDSTKAMCSRSKNARVLDSNNAISYENDGEIFGLAPITSIYKTQVFKDLGYFDSVISRGDTEFLGRLSACYGEEALVSGEAVVMLCNQKATSLSWSVKLSAPRLIQKYRKSYRAFHSKNNKDANALYVEPAPVPRKFIAPVGLLSLTAIESSSEEKPEFFPIDQCQFGVPEDGLI